MKKGTKRGVLGMVLVAAVVVAGVYAMQRWASLRLPREARLALAELYRRTGVHVDFEQLTTRLARQSVRVEGLQVRVPGAGLTAGQMHGIVGIRAWFRNVIQIRNLSMQDARLTLTRNREGDFEMAAGPLEPPPPSTAPGPAAAAGPPERSLAAEDPLPAALPRVHVRQARLPFRLDCVDYALGTVDVPLRLPLLVTLTASEVFTYGDLPKAEWGTLTLTMRSPDGAEAFAGNLQARVSPFSRLADVSFTLEGTVEHIDMGALGTLGETLGVFSDRVRIEIDLDVREGAFLQTSQLRATLHDATLAGKLQAQYRKIVLPPVLTLTLPVKGTLEDPAVNVTQAVVQSVLRNIKDNPDYLFDQLGMDGKSLRDRLQRRRRDPEAADLESEKKDDTLDRIARELERLF